MDDVADVWSPLVYFSAVCISVHSFTVFKNVYKVVTLLVNVCIYDCICGAHLRVGVYVMFV